MTSQSSLGTGAMDERPCPKCLVNTLRGGEKHSLCFDCLDHGPVSMEDLRCDLCRFWRPSSFVQATAKYSEASLARRDALRLAEASAPQVRQSPMEVETPPVTAQIASGVSQPLGLTQDMVNAAVQSFFAQSLSSLQGPLLPGLSSLLGQGVPAGSSAAPSSQGELAPPAGKKSKSSKKKVSVLAKAKAAKEPHSTFVVPQSGPIEVEGSVVSSPGPSKKRKRASSKRRGAETTSIFDVAQASSDLSVGDDQASGFDRRSILDGSFGSSVSRFEGEEFPLFGGEALDRSCDRESSLGGRAPGPRSGHDRAGGAGVVPQDHSSPVYADVSRRTGAIAEQAFPRPSFDVPLGSSRSSIGPVRSNDRGGRVEADQESSSSEDETSDQAGGSNFRWALESVARRMDLPIDAPGPSRGTGRFASAPVRRPIRLPVAPALVKSFDKINKGVTAKKDVARTESTFPTSRVRPESIDTYRTVESEGGHQTSVPVEDPNLHLLSRKQGTVWSAYVKKARLSHWQTLSHQLMGQLSLTDHLTTLVQEFVDEADLEEGSRANIHAALGVLAGVVHAAERDSAHLGAQLDLTMRDADLRLLDVSATDVAELRGRPLFSGYTYANLSRSDISVMREHLRDEAMAKALLGKSAGSGTGKKTKGQKPAQPQAPHAPASTQPPFRGAQPPPPQGDGKRGGKGGGRFKGKGKASGKK